MVTGGDGSLLLHKYRYPDQRCALPRPWAAMEDGSGRMRQGLGGCRQGGSHRHPLLCGAVHPGTTASRPSSPLLLLRNPPTCAAG